MSHSTSLLLRILEVISLLGAAAAFVAYLFRARTQRSQSASSKHTAFSRQFFVVAILMGVGSASRAMLAGSGDDLFFFNWSLVLFWLVIAAGTRLSSSYSGEDNAS